MHNRGFTLIEGIIATGVISSALVVGLALAISNLNAAKANSDRIIAANLAREGVEVVRNIRDSNWLRRDYNVDKDTNTQYIQFYQWDDLFAEWPDVPSTGQEDSNYFDIYLNPDGFPMDSPTDYYYTIATVSGTSAAAMDLLSCVESGDISCRIQKLGNAYFQSDTQEPGASLTNFYRRINVKRLCFYNNKIYADFDPANVSLDCTQAAGTEEGLLVTSHVIWQEGGELHEVRVKERLYNWR